MTKQELKVKVRGVVCEWMTECGIEGLLDDDYQKVMDIIIDNPQAAIDTISALATIAHEEQYQEDELGGDELSTFLVDIATPVFEMVNNLEDNRHE